jgi:hypothetical protein
MGPQAHQACHDQSKACPNQSSPLDEACVFFQWWEMNTHRLMDPRVRSTNFKWEILSRYLARNPPGGPTPKGRAHRMERGLTPLVNRPPHVLHRPCTTSSMLPCMKAQLWSIHTLASIYGSLIQWLKVVITRIHGPTSTSINRGVHPLSIHESKEEGKEAIKLSLAPLYLLSKIV